MSISQPITEKGAGKLKCDRQDRQIDPCTDWLKPYRG
jgi:hypothetical protein